MPHCMRTKIIHCPKNNTFLGKIFINRVLTLQSWNLVYSLIHRYDGMKLNCHIMCRHCQTSKNSYNYAYNFRLTRIVCSYGSQLFPAAKFQGDNH